MGPHVSKTTTEELREKNFPGPGKFFPCFMVGGPCAQIERLTGNNVNYRKFKAMGPYISKTTTEEFRVFTSLHPEQHLHPVYTAWACQHHTEDAWRKASFEQ